MRTGAGTRTSVEAHGSMLNECSHKTIKWSLAWHLPSLCVRLHALDLSLHVIKRQRGDGPDNACSAQQVMGGTAREWAL